MLCYCCLIRPKEIALLKCSDGIDGNGKETDFTSEELETLKAAFRDLARRLCEAADKL